MTAVNTLAGQRVLLVEDEWFVADDYAVALETADAEVIGPVGTVEGALALIVAMPRIDGALLDLDLQGELSFPVADALLIRGVPFVFVTDDEVMIAPRHAGVTRFEKSVNPVQIVRALLS